MARPKYKEMYLEQKKRADYWAEQHTSLSKQLTDTRTQALQASKDRAAMRSDFYTLHQKASTFLDRLRHDVLAPSAEKNDWLYLTAMDPETAQSFLRNFGALSTYISNKQPPIL